MNGKVLVCAPTSSRHKYVIDEWLDTLAKQTYRNFDILLIDTSETEEFFEYLQSKGLRILRNRWDPTKSAIIQHLAYCREQYRQIAINENYDYIFNLDTDILLPPNGIEQLVKADKDQVGYVVHVYPKGASIQPPCVFKEGGIKLNQDNPKRNGLQYYSWSWVYKYKGQLKKVYATGLGVLMTKRKVFSVIPFRTHPTFLMGEDMWYYAEADEKKFEAWCLVKRVKHKNARWGEVSKRENRRMSLYFAIGPENAKNAVFIEKKEVASDAP